MTNGLPDAFYQIIEANAADIMQSVKIAAQMENISEDEIIERWLGDSADDES
jgi:hypothetical protein